MTPIIETYHCPKGIFGLGGKAIKNKLKDPNFIFPMANITILSIIRTHAQKAYRKVWEMKNISILNILALLFFGKLAMHLLNIWSNIHTVQRCKFRGVNLVDRNQITNISLVDCNLQISGILPKEEVSCHTFF